MHVYTRTHNDSTVDFPEEATVAQVEAICKAHGLFTEHFTDQVDIYDVDPNTVIDDPNEDTHIVACYMA